MQAVEARHHQRKRPAFTGAETQAGNQVQHARRHEPDRPGQIKPFHHGKNLLWRHRHGLLLVFPYFRIGKDRVHERVMGQQECDADQRQACADEMEDGEQVQMVCINLALVAGQWGEFIHIAESTVQAPACCPDIEMAGERSWSEIYSGTDLFTIFILR